MVLLHKKDFLRNIYFILAEGLGLVKAGRHPSCFQDPGVQRPAAPRPDLMRNVRRGDIWGGAPAGRRSLRQIPRDPPYSNPNAAITGTWSEGRSHPRASRNTSMAVRFAAMFGDDQT